MRKVIDVILWGAGPHKAPCTPEFLKVKHLTKNYFETTKWIFLDMSRKAIIIGGYEPDVVEHSVDNWCTFLSSLEGGAWNDNEIQVLINRPTEQIRHVISEERASHHDFVIVAFMGHGTYQNDRTELAVNVNDDIITDIELLEIANKQISLFDCCRPANTQITDVHFNINEQEQNRNNARAIYDGYITMCADQQVKMYSASIGEHAIGIRGVGNLFTNCIFDRISLEMAQNRNVTAIPVDAIGHQAANCTTYEAERRGYAQHPQIIVTPNNSQPILPIAVRSLCG